jgi:hypothetical protein
MNPSYMVISQMVLVTPLVIWITTGLCRKEEKRLARWASLVTLLIQCIACFILRKHFVADPFSFSLAFIFCQTFIHFQLQTAGGLRESFHCLRVLSPVISVMLSAFLYTVLWWILAGRILILFTW